MTNDYAMAWDALADAIGRAKGLSSGSITEIEHMTIDQQLKVAEVAALLSIAQEISALNPNNVIGTLDGHKVNAWGMRIP